MRSEEITTALSARAASLEVCAAAVYAAAACADFGAGQWYRTVGMVRCLATMRVPILAMARLLGTTLIWRWRGRQLALPLSAWVWVGRSPLQQDLGSCAVSDTKSGMFASGSEPHQFETYQWGPSTEFRYLISSDDVLITQPNTITD